MLVSCDALISQQLTPNDTGQFGVPGGFAQCLADGQYCPTLWLSGRCDAGQATALCASNLWRSVCAEVGGGSDDAATDGADGDG